MISIDHKPIRIALGLVIISYFVWMRSHYIEACPDLRRGLTLLKREDDAFLQASSYIEEGLQIVEMADEDNKTLLCAFLRERLDRY